MVEDIRVLLLSKQDLDYKKFNENLIPGINNIIGIRMPVLRLIAKDLSKEANILEFLNDSNEQFHEEIMIKGMIIDYMKLDIDERFSLLKQYIPKINNWAICDSTIISKKYIKKNKKAVYEFVLELLKSNSEFQIRYGVLILLTGYLEEEDLDDTLVLLDNVKYDAYYVKMAVAWTIQGAFIKNEEKTMRFLNNNNLDKWTYNKAIQKIIESNRVSNETKIFLKTMKVK